MIHFDLPKEKSSILKVIGVGGGGSNAVNHMFSQSIEGVNFIICNTDAQAIAQSLVPNKIQLGPHLTQGLGAGANPEIGKQATEESLEEIKRILEVNTKMAFITAGMGGGTGTGGAPIISKICKDLGILTVGIVTTPFSYEGKKRQLQAEEGIRLLKQHVDTLLVISNDKLRHQFGNLKMKDAFAKADNVLATAAKCITDVITSTGQINVDFADVCTVMRNGGVAILGNAEAAGENRAQRAIEETLNSPLLNDNDIRGAKWILINISSAEGDNEFTMDEVETIQSYLISRAGEGTDVILGMGYDNSLGNNIGITLIATGFEYKDPFTKAEARMPVAAKEEKIVLSLEPVQEKKKDNLVLPQDEREEEETVREMSAAKGTYMQMPSVKPADQQPPITTIGAHLQPSMIEFEPSPNVSFTTPVSETTGENKLDTNEPMERFQLVYSQDSVPAEPTAKIPETKIPAQKVENNSPATAVSGGYLAKPSNIYAEPRPEQKSAVEHSRPLNEPNPAPVPQSSVQKEEEPSFDMQLVIRDETKPAADRPMAPLAHDTTSQTLPVEEPPMVDEADEQRRKATERIQKLRNLSFNINAADPNNEFETVPAYIRRNLDLYNTVNSVENFYSNYTVKTDDDNNTQISTINTFLDGEKPD
jgi:cell division protein FtsZ